MEYFAPPQDAPHKAPQKQKAKTQQHLLAHLQQLLEHNVQVDGTCCFLPSMMSLSKMLNCSELELHNALHSLEKQGYQFLTLGLDTPLTVNIPNLNSTKSSQSLAC